MTNLDGIHWATLGIAKRTVLEQSRPYAYCVIRCAAANRHDPRGLEDRGEVRAVLRSAPAIRRVVRDHAYAAVNRGDSDHGHDFLESEKKDTQFH